MHSLNALSSVKVWLWNVPKGSSIENLVPRGWCYWEVISSCRCWTEFGNGTCWAMEIFDGLILTLTLVLASWHTWRSCVLCHVSSHSRFSGVGLCKHGLNSCNPWVKINLSSFKGIFSGVLSQEKDVKNIVKKPAFLYGFYFRVIWISIKDGNNSNTLLIFWPWKHLKEIVYLGLIFIPITTHLAGWGKKNTPNLRLLWAM